AAARRGCRGLPGPRAAVLVLRADGHQPGHAHRRRAALDVALWTFPFRPVASAADQLALLTAKVVDFSCRDRLRKSCKHAAAAAAAACQAPSLNGTYHPDDAEFRSAYATWSGLRQELTDWFNSLDESFTNTAYLCNPPRYATPFGESIFFKTTTVGCIHALYLLSFILLLRAHPSNSKKPAESIAQSAFQCAPMATTIFRILAGLVYPHLHLSPPIPQTRLSDLTSIIYPVFLAGMQIKDRAQRDWILKICEYIQEITGYTLTKVLLGLSTAWGINPSSNSPSPLLDNDISSTSPSLLDNDISSTSPSLLDNDISSKYPCLLDNDISSKYPSLLDNDISMPDIQYSACTDFIWVSRGPNVTNASCQFDL
ncbi:hypothetical protein NEOLI_004304, partial [Neolecta irregularis DAH-3]